MKTGKGEILGDMGNIAPTLDVLVFTELATPYLAKGGAFLSFSLDLYRDQLSYQAA